MTDDIAAIARGLSPAALDRIKQPEDGDCLIGPAVQFATHGLITASDDDLGWKWSERGLAVRDYLTSRRQG